jgi:hypothetical protein
MNERDLDIMHIADDLLTQQNVLIEQQRKLIDALTQILTSLAAK